MSAIDEFFQHQRYAIVEIDPSQGFGQAVYAKLRQGGREPFVVMAEPTDSAIQVAGTVYRDLHDVPDPLDGVIFNIEDDPERMLDETRTAIEKGVPRIWIENHCEADAAVRYALAHGAEVVDNVCSLLALDPNHMHWFHRRILDLVGKTPAPRHPQG